MATVLVETNRARLAMNLGFVLLLSLGIFSVGSLASNFIWETLKEKLGVDRSSQSWNVEFERLALSLRNKKNELNDAHRLFALWYITTLFIDGKFETFNEVKDCVEAIKETLNSSNLKDIFPKFSVDGNERYYIRQDIYGDVLVDILTTIQDNLKLGRENNLKIVNSLIWSIAWKVNIEPTKPKQIELAKDLVKLMCSSESEKDFFERLTKCERLHSRACYATLAPNEKVLMAMSKFSIFSVYAERLDSKRRSANCNKEIGQYFKAPPKDLSIDLELDWNDESLAEAVLVKRAEEFSQKCQQILNLTGALDLKKIQSLETIALFNELGCFKNRLEDEALFSPQRFASFDLENGPWALLPEQILKVELNDELYLPLPYTRVKSKEQLKVMENFFEDCNTFLAIDGYFITDKRIVLPENLFSLYKQFLEQLEDTDKISHLFAIVRMRQILYRIIRDSYELKDDTVKYINVLIALSTNLTYSVGYIKKQLKHCFPVRTMIFSRFCSTLIRSRALVLGMGVNR